MLSKSDIEIFSFLIQHPMLAVDWMALWLRSWFADHNPKTTELSSSPNAQAVDVSICLLQTSGHRFHWSVHKILPFGTINIFSPSIVVYHHLGSKWFWEIFSMSDNLFSSWHRLVFCSAIYHYFLSVAGILTILNQTTFLKTTKPSHMFNMLLSMKIWLNLILPFIQVIFSPTFSLCLLPKVWQYCEGNV